MIAKNKYYVQRRNAQKKIQNLNRDQTHNLPDTGSML